MPECDLCGETEPKLYTCKVCGSKFCEYCGSIEDRACAECLDSEEDEDENDGWL
jgi:hypothetical protein